MVRGSNALQSPSAFSAFTHTLLASSSAWRLIFQYMPEREEGVGFEEKYIWEKQLL
jgi:hypothetical protein